MPVAKTVATAQEMYYMTNGNYSTDIANLDVKSTSNAFTNMAVNNGEDKRFSYVLANRTDIPGLAYVIYQKHSEQFPDTIMCEANPSLNSNAVWVCSEALDGKFVESGSLQGTNWKAYLLSGNSGSSSFSRCSGPKPDDLVSPRGPKGTATCNEETGKYEYTWTKGSTIGNRPQTGSEAYQWAGSTFGTMGSCNGMVDYGCSYATFNGEDYAASSCRAYTPNACTGSTFINKGKCWAQGDDGSCAGAIIKDGGTCSGTGCADAQYSGTGCCEQCLANSGAPKCNSSKVWDGETYW